MPTQNEAQPRHTVLSEPGQPPITCAPRPRGGLHIHRGHTYIALSSAEANRLKFAINAERIGRKDGTGFYQVTEDLRRHDPGRSYNANLNLQYDFGNLAFKSITAYRDLTAQITDDSDHTSAPLFVYYATYGGKTFSEEAQVSSSYGGPINFLAGAQYIDDRAFDVARIYGAIFGLPYVGATPPANTNQGRQNIRTRSFAGYAELYIKPLEPLTITLGVRYSKDRREIDSIWNQYAVMNLDPGGPSTALHVTRRSTAALAGTSIPWATTTTVTSNGSVNSAFDSFTPLGGAVPMFGLASSEVIFGGVGTGLYSMLLFVILAVFIGGLMVGRTPEYLGKKIEGREMKLAMLYVLVFPLIILGFTAWASVAGYANSHLTNAGPHGLSEMLYAFTSGAGNNGSAFGGLDANHDWWNICLGLTMLAGRFFMILPVLAIAGAMLNKKTVVPGPGTFPTNGWLFTALLVAVIVIVGALTFFPALSLGPVVEHFQALHGEVM